MFEHLSIRDNFMSAEQALDYGLIDHIVEPDPSKWANLSSPPPNLAPLISEDEVQDYDFSKIVSLSPIYLNQSLTYF